MAIKQIRFYRRRELEQLTRAKLIELILLLLEHLRRLLAQKQKLLRKVERNSTNSSQPPSSDGPEVKKTKRKRRSGRKRGGQPGHPGYGPTLVSEAALAEPPKNLKPTNCAGCGKALNGVDPEPLRHQVFSLPPIRPEVREWRRHRLRCNCGHVTCAALPEGVPTDQLDASVKTTIAYHTGVLRNSKRSTERALNELYHLPISLGAVSEAEEKVSAALAEPVREAVAAAQAAEVAYADETRMKLGWGQLGWLWVVVTCAVVVFQLEQKRNRDAARSLLGCFRGVLVTDRYRVYWVLGTQRQICWAHLLRDFQALALEPRRAGKIGAELARHAKRVFRFWYRVRDGTLTRAECQRRTKRVRRRIEALLTEGALLPEIGGVCRDMLAQRDALWTFLERDGVEPTNNGAERALRHAVLWRKCSYGVQSERGARYLERILTVQATCRLQERNTWEYLLAACQAHQRGQPAPSLLPTRSVVRTPISNSLCA